MIRQASDGDQRQRSSFLPFGAPPDSRTSRTSECPSLYPAYQTSSPDLELGATSAEEVANLYARVHLPSFFPTFLLRSFSNLRTALGTKQTLVQSTTNNRQQELQEPREQRQDTRVVASASSFFFARGRSFEATAVRARNKAK